MFIENKYTTYYYQIINHALTRNWDKVRNEGTEQHHIIPKSMGGSNETGNLVVLTPREHFICHMLLMRMVTGAFQKKMINAMWYMSNTRHIAVTSKQYERLRMESSKMASDRFKGRPISKEALEKRIRTVTGRKRPAIGDALRGIPKPGVSAALKGRKQPPELVAKRAASLKGKPSGALGRKQSDEERAMRSEIMKGRPSERKGRTYEEMYGPEKAAEVRRLQSERRKARATGESNATKSE